MNTKNVLKYFSVIGNKVTNMTQKETKALEDSAEAFRKTNKFKVYADDNISRLNERFELKLPEDVINLLQTKSEVPYTLFLIMFTVKRIQATNRPPIKIEALSLEEYNIVKKYLESLQQ